MPDVFEVAVLPEYLLQSGPICFTDDGAYDATTEALLPGRDVFSRLFVRWATGTTQRAELATTAFEIAIDSRLPATGGSSIRVTAPDFESA